MKYADLIGKLGFDDLKEIVEKYSEKYSNKQIKPTENIFEIINMREDSHSRLLLWLLNAKGKDKNSLQYRFLKNFIKLLADLRYISDVDVDALAGDINVTTQESFKLDNMRNSKYIDLLLCSKNANFICVIENKLDAKVNIGNDGITQLESYYDFVKQKKYKNKLCLFLCCDKNKIKLKGEEITDKELFDEFGYESIEHSDIALILYQTLLSYDGFDCDIFMEGQDRDKFLHEIKGIKSYENVDDYNFEIDRLLETETEGLSLLDKQLEILREYVQYWEFYNKFVNGYSKIVPTEIKDKGVTQYVYMWNVCDKIKKKPEYENLSPELENIVKEIAPR